MESSWDRVSAVWVVLAMVASSLLLQTCSASAVLSTHHLAKYGPQEPNWQAVVAVKQFDPNLGNLISVTVSLLGTVTGDAKYENLDEKSAITHLHLSCAINVSYPHAADAADAGHYVTVTPVAERVDVSTPRDPDDPLGANSRREFTGLRGEARHQEVLTAEEHGRAMLAPFVGLHTADFVVTARDISSGEEEEGEIETDFRSEAAVDIVVEYHYSTIDIPKGQTSSKGIIPGHLHEGVKHGPGGDSSEHGHGRGGHGHSHGGHGGENGRHDSGGSHHHHGTGSSPHHGQWAHVHPVHQHG